MMGSSMEIEYEEWGSESDQTEDRRLLKVLNMRQVQAITGLSRTTIARAEAAGDFPARIEISVGRVGWFEADILGYLKSKRKKSTTTSSTIWI